MTFIPLVCIAFPPLFFIIIHSLKVSQLFYVASSLPANNLIADCKGEKNNNNPKVIGSIVFFIFFFLKKMFPYYLYLFLFFRYSLVCCFFFFFLLSFSSRSQSPELSNANQFKICSSQLSFVPFMR